ncbi:hypothetical protein BpHYR1_026560 [Brachionus plicatilis]|uniref:Uncharacterized protein n=1 Tax=Brachionus plicatilis TaxID=10195 RepID=A0A3M7R7D4_BRAPC|nr:hypothetical protein BpHYR1_026560 [Brachionus plicatilis]
MTVRSILKLRYDTPSNILHNEAYNKLKLLTVSNRLFELSERYVRAGLSHSVPLTVRLVDWVGRPVWTNRSGRCSYFFRASKIILFPRIENNTYIYHPNIYSTIEALKTEENQIAFAYHGKIPVPYRLKLVVYTDASYTFRRQMLILWKLTVDEYIGMILATMSEEEKKTKKCVVYSGDISDSDSEEEEIYDDASDEVNQEIIIDR